MQIGKNHDSVPYFSNGHFADGIFAAGVFQYRGLKVIKQYLANRILSNGELYIDNESKH